MLIYITHCPTFIHFVLYYVVSTPQIWDACILQFRTIYWTLTYRNPASWFEWLIRILGTKLNINFFLNMICYPQPRLLLCTFIDTCTSGNMKYWFFFNFCMLEVLDKLASMPSAYCPSIYLHVHTQEQLKEFSRNFVLEIIAKKKSSHVNSLLTGIILIILRKNIRKLFEVILIVHRL